jgi:GTPase SAR1 family protein
MVYLFAIFQDYKLYENVDAYVIIYSKTDRESFAHAVDLLEEVLCDRERHPAVILVANKSDLVRTRQIASDGKFLMVAKNELFA